MFLIVRIIGIIETVPMKYARQAIIDFITVDHDRSLTEYRGRPQQQFGAVFFKTCFQ